MLRFPRWRWRWRAARLAPLVVSTLVGVPMLAGCTAHIGAGLERANFVHEGSLATLRAKPTYRDHADAIEAIVARWQPTANVLTPTVERYAAPVVPVVVASRLPDDDLRDCYYADRSRRGCLRISLMVRDGATGNDAHPESLPPPR